MNLDAYYDVLDRQEAEVMDLAGRLPEGTVREGAESRWSPLEELEHVCLLEGLVAGLLQRHTEERAGVPELFGNAKLEELLVAKRSYKIKAPEPVLPKGAFHSIVDFRACFTQQRRQLKDDLRSGRVLPDDRTFRHPMLGALTAADWLYFLVQHTQRHLLSLRESTQQTTLS